MAIYEDKDAMWRKLGGSITGIHASRFNAELSQLEGKEFIDAYIRVLEFFAPKLARKEVKAELSMDDKVITIEVVGSAPLQVSKGADMKLVADTLDEITND